MEQISIPLNAETASLYLKASSEKKKKAERLINLWLKDFFKSSKNPKKEFLKIMKKTGKMAKEQGMTPEILEQILNEES